MRVQENSKIRRSRFGLWATLLHSFKARYYALPRIIECADMHRRPDMPLLPLRKPASDLRHMPAVGEIIGGIPFRPLLQRERTPYIYVPSVIDAIEWLFATDDLIRFRSVCRRTRQGNRQLGIVQTRSRRQ